MTTETVTFENDVDSEYESGSADLLAEWLQTLELKSSLFWTHHYADSGFSEIGENEKCSSSIESTRSTVSDTDLENIDDEDEGFNSCADVFAETPCKSIAHRESDLLVALSENCTLGPVCYFCRYM